VIWLELPRLTLSTIGTGVSASCYATPKERQRRIRNTLGDFRGVIFENTSFGHTPAEAVIGEAHIDAEGGLVRLVFSSLCVRCDATRVDYVTGARPDTQPLAWLARNRPPRDEGANAATFAINGVFPRAAHAHIFRLSDVVRIVSERV
jgi:hypothetical protein